MLMQWNGECFKNQPVNLDDFTEELFVGKQIAIFIIATHYNGLFTDNCIRFVKWLRSLYRDGRSLGDLKYTIWGLGNSSYEYYNKAAKDLRQILTDLGAAEFCEVGYGDELVGLRNEFDKWLPGLYAALEEIYSLPTKQLDLKRTIKHTDSWRNIAPLEIRYVSADTPIDYEFGAGDVICRQQLQCVNSKVLSYDRQYNTADTVYVLYRSPEHIVNYFVKKLGITDDDLQKLITFVPRYNNNQQYSMPFPIPCTVKDALELYLDLTTLPSDDVLMDLCSFLRTSQDCGRLNEVIGNETIMSTLRTELSLMLPEFITLFMGNVRFNLSGFLQIMPKKVPRPYTLSSSALRDCNLTLTVKLIHNNLHSLKRFYNNYYAKGIFARGLDRDLLKARREYMGGCSTYLCSLAEGESVKLYVRPSEFSRIDSLERPMLLVSNGAGIAPFRGLWQRFNDNNRKMLILGFRTKRDILYFDELTELEKMENVTINYALSREDNKIYVQELIKRNSREVMSILLSDNSLICICGSRAMGNQLIRVLDSMISVREYKESNRLIEELW